MAASIYTFRVVNFVAFRGIVRNFSTGELLCGKRNFRKFQTFNKRGSYMYRQAHKNNPEHDLGVRPTGFWKDGKFVTIPEMVPELVVPDLSGFELKPYVSYRVPDVVQSKFTAKDLFDACYADKVMEDFKTNKLDEAGNPLEPSEAETTTADDAKLKTRQTGSDLF